MPIDSPQMEGMSRTMAISLAELAVIVLRNSVLVIVMWIFLMALEFKYCEIYEKSANTTNPWHISFRGEGKCRDFPRIRFTFPRVMRLLVRSSMTCLGKCLVYRSFEKEHLLDLR
jgi:hypothetical protein